MVRFRCPNCQASIEHRPEKAGGMGNCDRCGGKFVEPSDPLPGSVAIAWEEAGSQTAAAQPAMLKPRGESSKSSKPAGSLIGSLRALSGKGTALNDFDTRQILAPLADLRLRGVLVAWSPDEPGSLKVGHSSGCPKDEADRMVLEAALQWIRRRSPKLHQKLLLELAKLADVADESSES